jgi:hypothetical protein
MSQRRISPSLVIATIALVVVASSGSAVAATLITGAQIKDRSITAVDVAANTLTGNEVAENTLGKVRWAGAADKVGGLGATSFLRSSRIQSGTVDFTTVSGSATKPVFTNAQLGLRVSFQPPARLHLTNLNPADDITVTGLGFYSTNSNTGTYSRQQVIAPGASDIVSFDAVGFTYGTFLVTKQTTPISVSPSIQLTCAMNNRVNHTAFSCIGIG